MRRELTLPTAEPLLVVGEFRPFRCALFSRLVRVTHVARAIDESGRSPLAILQADTRFPDRRICYFFAVAGGCGNKHNGLRECIRSLVQIEQSRSGRSAGRFE